MAANDDFFIKFGSDAPTFVKKLKSDLQPAFEHVAELGTLLQALDAQAGKTASSADRALAQVAGRDASGGKGVAGDAVDASKLTSSLDVLGNELSTFAGKLESLSRALDPLTDQVKKQRQHENRSAGATQAMESRHVDPKTGRILPAGGERFVPGAYPMGQKYAQQAPSLRQLGTQQVQLAPVSISALSRVQIDEAGFDRVVAGLTKVEAAVNRLGAKIQAGVPIREGGEAPSGAVPAESKSGRKTATSRVADEDEVVSPQDLQALKAQMEGIARERRQMLALFEEMGIEISPELQEKLQESQKRQEGLKAQIAKLEREGGMTRDEQSARRKEEYAAQKGPDLTREEYDRRMGIREALVAPANAERFAGSVGRGQGQINKQDLRFIAEAFKSVGFDPGLRSRDTNDQMVEKILAARGRYSAQYAPGEFPEGLEVGRKPRQDPKVDDTVRSILGALNAAGPAAERVEAAWETLKRSAQSGGDVPRPVMEPGYAMPGMIDATGNMIKGRPGVGAAIVDESELVEARLEIAQDRLNRERMGLARAVQMSQIPEWDAYHPALREGIKGPSRGPDDRLTEAGRARIALAQLRRAQDEVDELGAQFRLFTAALDENEKFIQRATSRIGTDMEKPTDQVKLWEAEDIRERLTGQIQGLSRDAVTGEEIPGLRDLFDSDDFWAGWERRGPGRDERALARTAERERGVSNFLDVKWLSEGLGGAMGGARLAQGTKQTYIRNVPGLAYGGGQYRYASGEGDPTMLQELNQRNQQYVQAFRKFQRTEPDTEEAEQAWRHLENKAVHFLNQIEQMFGMAPPLEGLTGRPASESASRDELARNARWRAGQEAAVAKLPKATDAENLENAREVEATLLRKKIDVERRLAETTARLDAARKAAEAAERKTIEGLDPDARARLDAAQEWKRDAEKRMRTLQGQLARDPELDMRSTARKYGDTRFEEGDLKGAFRDPGKRDTFGYDFDLGYGRNEQARQIGDLDFLIAKASKAAAAATEEVNAALGRETTEVDRLETEHRGLTQEVARLSRASSDAAAKVAELTKGVKETAGASATAAAASDSGKGAQARTTAEQQRIDALKKERAELQAGPHTLGDKRRLGGYKDDPGLVRTLERQVAAQKGAVTRAEGKGQDATEARTRLAAKEKELQAARAQLELATKASERIRKINAELDSLGARGKKSGAGGAGGAGGGDGGDAGGASGASPDDDGLSSNILRQILAAINAMHATIKSGVKVHGTVNATGSGSGATTGGASTTRPKSTGPSVPGGGARLTDEQRQAREAAVAETRATRQKRLETRNAADKLRLVEEEERLTKRQEQAAVRSTVQSQERARAAQRLTAAQRVLNTEAAEAIVTLERMVAEGADAADVAHQQAKAYNAVSRALSDQNIAASDQRSIQQTLQSKALGRSINQAELGDIEKSARAVGGFKRVDQAMASGVIPGGIFGEESAFTQAMFGNHGFWSRMMSSTGTFIVRNFAAGFVFGMTNALQEVMAQAILTESSWVRVSDALEQTGRTSGNLRTDLQSIASDYGVALNDVYQSAAGLTGMFESTEDIAGATRVVAQLEAISMGALNAKEGMGALASITGAFRDSLPEGVAGLDHVADVLTVVQNTLGTNIEITAEGVGALSGLAAQLRIDFEDTAVYAGQIAKLTNQTGAAAGEQFGRILGSMQTGRARGALQEALPDSGINTLIGQGEYGEALKVLLREWDGLSEAQQRNLTVSIAGQRQARAFAALMNNNEKVLNASARAHNAQGEAAERAANIARTLNRMITRLGVNFQNLAQNLLRTGILNFFGGLLAATNSVLDVANKLFSQLNDFADDHAFLSFLTNIGFGLLGLVATLTIATKAFHGFKASLAAMTASPGVMGAGLRGAGAAGAPSLRETMQRGSWYLDRKSGDLADRARQPGIVAWASAEKGKLDREHAKSNRVYQGASKAVGGLSRAVGGLASMSAAAGFGLLAVTAGIAAIWSEISESEKHAEEFRERWKKLYETPEKGKAGAPSEDPYYGPMSEAREARIKQTSGFWNSVGGTFQQSWENFKNPRAWAQLETEQGRESNWKQDLKDFFLPKPSGLDRYRGDLSEEWEKRLDDMGDEVKGMLDAIQPDSTFTEKLFTDIEPKLAPLFERPALTVESARQAQEDIDAMIAKERAKIDSSDMSDHQKEAAAAELEKIAYQASERLASIILLAQGIAEADQITLDQVRQINALRGLFAQTQGTGVGLESEAGFGAEIEALISNVGLRDGSEMGDRLRRMAEGNLGTAEFMIEDQKALYEEIQNVGARYRAMESGEMPAENEEIQALEQELIGLIGQYATKTEEIIQAFIGSSTAIANAAAGRGEYGAAAAALNAGLAGISTTRNRETETDEVRAARDVMEQQQADQAAAYLAEEQNARLNVSKARSMSGQRDAQLEVRIARNAYNALLAQQELARQTNTQGPSIAAIRAAKIAWIEAENSNAQAAQAANIAMMMAAAAGTWNSVEAAVQAEAIAFQQYLDAKENSGPLSTEAMNAYAAYKNAGKATVQAADQVAQAQRDAALAAIPQGNTVAVAEQGVRNAEAALAAALKYGVASTEYQGALAALYSAQQQAQNAQSQVAQAQANLAGAYASARGDAVAAAAAGVQAARQALAWALVASGGVRSPDVMNAEAQLVSANAAMGDSILERVQSRTELAIALAEASGHTVRAARLELRKANQALAYAVNKSGGEETAEVRSARADRVAAQAGLRDSIYQDRLDTIDFRLEMERITANGAIAMLQNMLKTMDLTKQQRRELLLKIKGLKEDLRSELTGSGFNIPDQIQLPTAYEVRRSLGMQEYGRAYRSSVSATAQALRDAQTGPQRTTGGGNDSALVAAVREVRTAIESNGARVAQDIKIENTVLTSQMVEQISRRVVKLIQDQTRTGARANSSRAKLVR